MQAHYLLFELLVFILIMHVPTFEIIVRELMKVTIIAEQEQSVGICYNHQHFIEI